MSPPPSFGSVGWTTSRSEGLVPKPTEKTLRKRPELSAATTRFLFLVKPVEDGLETYALTVGGVPYLVFSANGETACVQRDHATDVEFDNLIRWGAPVALAAMGIPCLHGSAVVADCGLMAILGIGGAGKSTLARCFGRHGASMVLDDLIVCDVSGRVDLAAESIVRAWSVEAAKRPDVVCYADLAAKLRAGPSCWQSLSLVVLLGSRLGLPELDEDMAPDDEPEETSGGPPPEYRVQRWSPIEGLEQIILHRFGSHPSPAAWAPQLKAVAAISHRAACVSLSVPDGLERLEAALPGIAEALQREALTP